MGLLTVAVAHLSPAHAETRLPPIFSAHMVLQASSHTRLWGTAPAGQKIHLALANQTADTRTAPDGTWRAELDLSRTGPGPWTATIAGDTTITLDDVAIGDVWLCSGQSNMGWLMKDTVAVGDEVRRPRNPLLRTFTVDKRAALSPLREIGGRWTVAQADTVPAFSAVAYYFGQALEEKLHRPIGLIHSSWGGTPIESWMSREALAPDPELAAKTTYQIHEYESLPARQAQYLAALKSFEDTFHRQDRPALPAGEFAGPSLNASSSAAPSATTSASTPWQKVRLPGSIQPASAGALWLRRSISVAQPAGPAGLSLYLGIPRGFEQVYWNGEKIGEMTPARLTGREMPRTYTVPGRLIRPGENVLAIRLFAPAGGAALTGTPGDFRFSTLAPLAGEWDARWEYEFPSDLAAVDRWTELLPAFVPDIQQIPTSLYNAKIAPLAGYTLRGVAWYQGEANVGQAPRYAAEFPRLIADWRAKWEQPDLPFVFCQLANYKEKTALPGDSDLAALREAQASALSVPGTGMAVLIDQGEVDVHYRTKREAGRRLALAALRAAWHEDVIASAPAVISKTVTGPVIRLRFDDQHGALVAHALPATYPVTSSAGTTSPLVRNSPASELEGFQICGPDHQWHWADARLAGLDVIVSSPQVASPTEVRYAWSDNPAANLYSTTGLPVAPFRTDR